MTHNDTHKFLFDLNNFDSGAHLVPDTPPPPVFTEEEIEDAKKKSFKEGVLKGIADEAASRERRIADLIVLLQTGITSLIDAENERIKKFESDTLSLVCVLSSQLFPVLKSHVGGEQITQTVMSVLELVRTQPEITIFLSPHDLDEVESILKPAITGHAGTILIQTQSDMAQGSFDMKWKDGGAARDCEVLATQITSAIARVFTEKKQTTSL